MISSGLFVLPAVIYPLAGPGIILAYIFAGLLMIPAMLSKAELATAMPKAGGTYFFVERSLGSLMGTFAGLANWFSISLKGAFALIGMGAFLRLIIPGLTEEQIKFIALGLVFFFLLINMIGARESSRMQVIMVAFLLSILLFFIFSGFGKVSVGGFSPFVPEGWKGVFTATGMVFISYGGLTKVVSLSGETVNPGKTMPRAMISSFILVNFIYVFSVFIVAGVLEPAAISATLAPLSLTAEVTIGRIGLILLTAAAALAFATTANASLMSASRAPLAMAKDELLPAVFGRETRKRGVPLLSLMITTAFLVLVILFLNIEQLVKVASTMMLILFLLVNLSVILMRESRILTYKPEFRAPVYPFLQIAGIGVSVFLIIEMGTIPLLITAVFFLLALFWYLVFARRRKKRESALIHIVDRVVSKDVRSRSLVKELTAILLERDNIVEDRFDNLISRAEILDITEEISVHELFDRLAAVFSERLEVDKDSVFNKLVEREKESTTAIYPSLAIPHIVVDKEAGFDICVVRARRGIVFSPGAEKVTMIFCLAGAREEREFHLKALMSIAQIVQKPAFQRGWDIARDGEELRNLILTTERQR
jgi:amino acid transporter/mannitol/fructose-specific phosphotransferase system IIA component (Ntr-type)